MKDAIPVGCRVRVALTVAVIPFLLRLASFTRLAAWLGRGGAPASSDAGLDDASLAHWLDHLLRRLPGPWRYTCLKRAVVLYHVLRKAGRPVELCIGVRQADTTYRRFNAHAWLVCNGVPYLEHTPEAAHGHAVIARFPEHGGAPA